MKNNKRTFRVYALTNPLDNNNIFYVGVTCQSIAQRKSEHCHGARRFRGKNLAKESLIRTIENANQKVGVICLQDNIESIDDAELAETWAIEHYRSLIPSMCNVKNGGYDYKIRCDKNANGWLQ